MWCLPPTMLAICFAQPWWFAVAGGCWWLWQRQRGGCASGLMLALMVLLVWRVDWAMSQALQSRVALQHAAEERELSGRVDGLPLRTRLGGGPDAIERVRFDVIVEPDGASGQGPRRLRLTWHSADTAVLQPGTALQLRVRLQPIWGQINQAGFDVERHALANRVDGRGSVLQLQVLAQGSGRDWWRERLSRRLSGQLEGRQVASALVPALVVGDRRNIEPHHWDTLQATGTAHLMAISGLHITLVAGLVWWAGRWLLAGLFSAGAGLRVAADLALLPAMLAACGYAALAGFALPTQRALLMTLCLMLAWALRVRWPLQTVLLSIWLLVAILDPLALLDNSFWLSFGAVALLALLHSAGGAGVWRAQVALTLVFGALAASLFGVWSLAALPANLLFVPLYSFLVVPLALLGALMPGASALLVWSAWLMEWSWPLLEYLQRLPGLPLPDALAAVLVSLLILRCLLPALPGPIWVWGVCLLPWLWPAPGPLPHGQVQLTAFDVGQGQLLALRTRHHLVLFDVGPGWQEGDAASRTLMPWLSRHRVQPDLVFVSHSHLDHAGGLDSLLARHAVAALYAGEPERTPASRPCLRGQAWQFDGVDITVLWPLPDLPLRHSNNRSCVVRVVADNQTILLTGDIGRDVEHWLVRHDDVRADVLQMPHHGSATSSSHSFVRAVSPDWAFASAGHNNRFAHPAQNIMDRYRELGIPVLVTGQSGMLVFDGDHQEPARLRRDRPFPWRHREPVVE
jgi:competence protein ComEC